MMTDDNRTGAAKATLSAPAKNGLLLQLIQRGHDAMSSVTNASDRLHSEIDVLIGSTPEAPAVGDVPRSAQPTQHNGIYGELEIMIDRLESMARGVEEAVARACRLNN